ncbi:MAG: MiaB/RimO family radical SAM methylthiotransferase, partial [Desulfocucumaceae bacterium]
IPDGLVVVTGCYSQVSPEEVLNIPGVDLVMGTADRAHIVDRVEDLKKGQRVNAVLSSSELKEFEEIPSVAASERVRAFLKIQEGCNNFCSYCIVPYARGPLRSRNAGNIMEEAVSLVKAGYKEIVLTGIHTGAYGRDRPDGLGLAGLMADLSGVSGLERIRLSSVEPQDITDHLISLIAQGPPFCPHLHIPIQSGDDEILGAMKRHYSSDYIRRLVGSAREKIKDLSVTTDVIVGFPGEIEKNFLNTYNLVEELKVSAMHIFKYSLRKGTAAAGYSGQVPPEEKERRSKRLTELGVRLAGQFAARYLDKEVEVLAEEEAGGDTPLMQGHTANYLRVIFPGDPGLRGRIVPVRAEKLSGNELFGRIIYKHEGFKPGHVE